MTLTEQNHKALVKLWWQSLGKALVNKCVCVVVGVGAACDHITLLLRQLHWLKVPWRVDFKLNVLVYNVFMVWHRHTSLTSLSSSRVAVSKASAFRFVSWTVCSPYCQPTATELFQLPLYGSGTVFRSISHLLHHFPSSALTWRHTSSNCVTHNYCCRAREVTLSFWTL